MNALSDTSREPPDATNRSRRGSIKPILFRLAAVLIPILLLESGARLYWALFLFRPAEESIIQEHQVWHSAKSDELIPIDLPVNAELDVATTRTRTNNLGLRNNEDIDPHSDPLTTRILCIGDSVTFGYTVTANEQTYPAVLENWLRHRGVPCQVINAGMPRFRIQHLVNLFKERLAVLNSDVVIVLGGWNDARDNILVTTPSDWSLRQWIDDHIYLVKVIRRWNVVPTIVSTGRPEAGIAEEGLQRFERSLNQLVVAAQDHGATVMLCTLPNYHSPSVSEAGEMWLYQFYPRGDLEQLVKVTHELNDRIRAVAGAQNAILVDLDEIDRESWFSDAVHPNDPGSAKIAEVIGTSLLQHVLVKP